MSLETLQQAQLNRMLGGIRIPPQPDLLMAIQEEKYQQEPDLGHVGQLISRDVGLTAAVLKCVNNPMFGLPSKVTSAAHGVSLLGLDAAFNLTTAVLLQQVFRDEVELQPFWDSAANIARLGSYLARRLGNASQDEMYLLGLFHNSAMPLMMSQLPGYRQQLRVSQGEAQVAMEERLYQTNHAVVAYLMAREWGLPQDIRDAILDHHRVAMVLDGKQRPQRYHRLLANLKLAEHVDHLFGHRQDPEWAQISGLVLGQLVLSDLDYRELVDEMQDLLLDPQ